MNSFATRDLPLEQLKSIAKDPKEPWSRAQAALRMVRAMEAPDMADFEPVLDGQMNLRELRASGKDTSAVKKVKEFKTVTRQMSGDVIKEETAREIELHDRSLEEAKFIVETTDGKPGQSEADQDKNPFRLLVSINIGGAETAEVPQVEVIATDAVALPSCEPNLSETGENP